MSADTQTPAPRRPSRRTLAAGAAWAVPAVAVTAASPAHAASGITTTTTTLPPCIGGIEATGGTYPVIPELWECDNPENNPNHWDFRLKFTVKAANCPYCKVQIRLWDNPERSSLIYTPTSHHDSGSGRAAYYVDSAEITPTPGGVSVVLPSTGQTVYQTSGVSTGVTITADGTANDALHALYVAGQGALDAVPCAGDTSMARYSVRYLPCGAGAVWGPWQGPFDIDPCIPMISATACRKDGTTDSITVNVAQSCGLSGNDFNLVQVRRSTDGSDPTSGTPKWNTGATLAAAPVTIDVARGGGDGSYYWVEFNNGDPLVKSRVRIARPANYCGPAPTSPVLTLDSSSCQDTNNSDPRVAELSWNGTANRIQRSTNPTFANNVTENNVSGNSYTYSTFQVDDCDTVIYFRVFQANTTNYSNVVSASGNNTNSAQARSSTEQPTTEQPTTEQPTTEQPTTEQPTTEQPTTEQPTTEQPTTEQPTTESATE